MQTTLKKPLTLQGIGLHTGERAAVTMKPAPADHGITVTRLGHPNGKISATWNNVIVSPLNTRLTNTSGVTISTIEHMMAALAGCGVHNVDIEVDGPEIPILDGSSDIFVSQILQAGIKTLNAPLQIIQILKHIKVEHNGGFASLSPSSDAKMSFEIDFSDPAIGHQEHHISLAQSSFVDELSFARTFCREQDVAAMRKAGLARGGSYDNAVVFGVNGAMNPNGLRSPDEPVRHKMLDALGDLYTAGAPILGHYTGYKAGHALTNQVLQALFADKNAWRKCDCDEATYAKLPHVNHNLNGLAYVA